MRFIFALKYLDSASFATALTIFLALLLLYHAGACNDVCYSAKGCTFDGPLSVTSITLFDVGIAKYVHLY